MFEPGDIIDRNYQVIERLAMGGAGVTYLVKALDDDGAMSGPHMALKLLFTARDHGAYLRRLSTEAQILQELQHPNIVKYLGFVHRTGQSPYLLTHFEEGGSLLDYMRRAGKFSIGDAVSIGRQVCWALEKGHAQGIIHRDLKPENLLLAEHPQPGESPIIRVADFGIAKVTGSLNSGLTRAGAFVGTPQYAAPEQFLGDPASDKADVYALGAVMAFLMTARPLVKDAHLLASEDVYTQLLDALPPVIVHAQEPEEDVQRINEILACAMACEPGDRCGVRDLDRMLANFLDGKEPLAPVMAVSEQRPQANIPLSIFSDDGKGGSAAHIHNVQASPTPTLRDEWKETDGPHSPGAPAEAQDSRIADRTSSEKDDAGRAGVRLFLFGTLGVVVLGFAGWLFAIDFIEQQFSEQQEPTTEIATESIEQEVEPTVLSEEEAPPVSPPPPDPPKVIDAVRNPSLGEKARAAALRAFKRNAQPIRRMCPAAVGKRIAIEVEVSKSGRISWARPLDRSRPEFKCVTDNMRRVKSGSRLKMATKVRLHVEP